MTFLREHLPEISGMVTMAVVFLIMSFISVKGSVKSIDQKRIKQGLTPLNDIEKKIISGEMRTNVLGDFMAALIAGIVALTLAGLF